MAQVCDMLKATGRKAMETMLALHLAENLLSELSPPGRGVSLCFLADAAVPTISQFLYELPYLRLLNLRGNYLSPKAQSQVSTLLSSMEGITNVITSPENKLLAHSGAQVRRTG